jgi:hypothetical protein
MMEDKPLKIFECDKCKKTFNNNYNLKKHLNKKFPCFDENTKILNEKTDENNNSIFYCCNFCDKKYDKKYRLVKHFSSCVKKREKNVINKVVEKVEETKNESFINENNMRDIINILKCNEELFIKFLCSLNKS